MNSKDLQTERKPALKTRSFRSTEALNVQHLSLWIADQHIHEGSEWQISIKRADGRQQIYGSIVSPNPSKPRSFIQRKSSY